ncbi:hypothetical protein ACJJJB_20905 [Microbulbifer sp. ANSA001]
MAIIIQQLKFNKTIRKQEANTEISSYKLKTTNQQKLTEIETKKLTTCDN